MGMVSKKVSGLNRGVFLGQGCITWKYEGSVSGKVSAHTHVCVCARTHTPPPTPHAHTSSKLRCSKDLSAVLSEHGNDGLHTDKNLQ